MFDGLALFFLFFMFVVLSIVWCFVSVFLLLSNIHIRCIWNTFVSQWQNMCLLYGDIGISSNSLDIPSTPPRPWGLLEVSSSNSLDVSSTSPRTQVPGMKQHSTYFRAVDENHGFHEQTNKFYVFNTFHDFRHFWSAFQRLSVWASLICVWAFEHLRLELD